MPNRPQSHVLARHIFTLWVVLTAVVYSLIGSGRADLLGQPWWAMVHVFTIGLIGSSILTWSWHFTVALGRLRSPDARGQTLRLALFTLGALILATGMVGGFLIPALVGMTLIGIALGWHVWAIGGALRAPLGTRMRPLLRFYIWAGIFLISGIALAYLPVVAALAGVGEVAAAWANRLIAAHAVVNIFGFIGLTLLGTLVTFGPTMLRTQMTANAFALGMRALPLTVAATTVMGAATVAGWGRVAVAAFALYAAGAALVLTPVLVAAWRKPPREFGAWLLVAGLGWLVAAWGAWFVVALRTTFIAAAGGGAGAVAAGAGAFLPGIDLRLASSAPVWLFIVGIMQVLEGAMCYLFPTLIGGGPAATRFAIGLLNRATIPALVAFNASALAALVLPGAGARLGVALLFVTATAIFVHLCAVAVAQVRFVRSRADG